MSTNHAEEFYRRANLARQAGRADAAALLDQAGDDMRNPAPTYGMCTACGSIEVALNRVTGHRNLSHIGEPYAYPTGYGCEVCA